MTQKQTLATLTVEYLGSMATPGEKNLARFVGWCRELMARDGLSESDAIETLWADGDYYWQAAELDLTAPDSDTESPVHCDRCGKAFGVNESIAEVVGDGGLSCILCERCQSA